MIRLLLALVTIAASACASGASFAPAVTPPALARQVGPPIVTQSPVGFSWGASSWPGVIGYNLYLDGNPYRDLGNVLSLPKEPIAPGPHTVYVTAYTASEESGPSNVLAFTVTPGPPPVDPACLPPLGNRAIAIVVTRLTKTGSGGPLSDAVLDFKLASPNSPIVRAAVRTRGADLGTPASGINVTRIGSLWFPIPAAPGSYPLTVQARNEFGCTTEVATRYTLVIP